MEYLKEHIELTEKVIKNSPGYKGNEDLLDEMIKETLKKAQSFLESAGEASSLEIYLKKIALNVIVETVKNAEGIRAAKDSKSQLNNEFKEIQISYKTDESGKIIYETDIPEQEEIILTDEQINNIKDKVPAKYKQIFIMRFADEMTHQEIAQKLEMTASEVAKTLLEIFMEIDYA